MTIEQLEQLKKFYLAIQKIVFEFIFESRIVIEDQKDLER